jgi:shikimate dehydrogenase
MRSTTENKVYLMMDETLALYKRIFCIISNQRVFQSKSPEIFNTVLSRSGINGAYVPFRIDEENIGMAMESLQVLNIAGANISAPFKEKVIPYMDVLSEGANSIGAVNTIVCKKGQLKGYNTNAMESWMRSMKPVSTSTEKER